MASEKLDKWFGDEPPSCALCEFGRWDRAHSAVLCSEKGVMDPAAHCKRYRYDPFRREPRKRPPLPEFDPKDFSL